MEGQKRTWAPFLAGVFAGGCGALLAHAFLPRKGLDPRLFRRRREGPDPPPAVVIPGILGSELLRPDGTGVWLNIGNALGNYDLGLPFTLPLPASRDELIPGGLLGVDAVLPRLFGFTEYADLLDLLEDAGFRRRGSAASPGARYHVFTFDWRRDLVESARALHDTLEALADARGDPQARFNVIGHSMGGLVARYYLRYGTAEPDEPGPVTWAGARRIRNLIVVAAPNAGSVSSLEAILYGNRVGLSSTTLAASVISRMPSIYQLLPPAGVDAMVDARCDAMPLDLHDVGTWERFGWGPFAPSRRQEDRAAPDQSLQRAFLTEALRRARAVHEALSRPPTTPCPVRVVALGGDCLPTLSRALVPDRRGARPRFDPWTRAEAEVMSEAGDGRVTRGSVLASHLPGAEESDTGSGLPEISHAFFGHADHHGIYSEPTFQSVLLRILLRPAPRVAPLSPDSELLNKP
jgi:pimeloyl-ACP methyl ester carboxylesterase